MTELEQLNERIAQLSELIKTTSETIKSLETALKAVEEERDRLAKLENGIEPKFLRAGKEYTYYYIGFREGLLVTVSDVDSYSYIDDNRFNSSYNYFHTKERTEEVADKIRLLLRLERLHDIYCPNCEGGRYYISQNAENGRYCHVYIKNVPNKNPTSTMFPSEEIAQKACDILNAELEEKE